MSSFGIMHWYPLGWITCCGIAVVLVLHQQESFELLQRDYWRLQSEPWKLATGLTATISLIVMAPYTGDPTWELC